LLSYQHLYHAGNFADVHKHTVLTLLLQALHKKPTGLCYLETHAGRALYDLHDPLAQKNREFAQGVSRILADPNPPAVIRDYLTSIYRNNPRDSALRFYPGSPLLAQALLREQDVMILAELHPQEIPVLRQQLRGDKRIAIHQRDGYEMLRALLPVKQTRGLVLIDPAYEQKSDYAQVITALELIQQRWRGGVAMVWYPILTASQHANFIASLRQSTLRDVLCCELQLQAFDGPAGMKGSGAIILQPPWQVDKQLQQLLAYLATVLQQENVAASWRVEQLIAE
jgi:23S rRNA (adenine2030-N6)-methyltransferase